MPDVNTKPLMVACPGCGKQTVYSLENSFRPFCCALCKGEDLAAWAEEKYRVAAVELDPEDELPDEA